MKICVIPARGGSKRIPRKNVRPFCGRPIVEYSIEAAITSGMFDHVVVSTDDDEIARISLLAGADVPFRRPDGLANNFVGTNDVVAHAIEFYNGLGTKVTAACCVYATAPFVRKDDICDGYNALIESSLSFAFSVTTYAYPIHRALSRDQQGRVRMLSPANAGVRSQDLEEVWHDAGQFYWGKAEAFVNRLSLFEGVAVGVPIPRFRVQDIDTEDDWVRAELMFRLLREQEIK